MENLTPKAFKSWKAYPGDLACKYKEKKEQMKKD